MKKTLILYKEIGKTPLQALEQFRQENDDYKDQKLGYAGRLDPMAEGLLLILIGDENKKRKEYERLDKTYEFEVLFGTSTDSYDVMGKIKKFGEARIDEKEINKLIKLYKGKMMQEYPPFSSPRVQGKPLFYWAREGRLNEIKIPKKKIEIKEIEVIGKYEIKSNDLLNEISNRLTNVSGEFRQIEILNEWEKLLKKEMEFEILKFRINCSSGTYVRSIANKMGNDLGIGGIAYKIKRTKIGKFKVDL